MKLLKLALTMLCGVAVVAICLWLLVGFDVKKTANIDAPAIRTGELCLINPIDDKG